MTKKSDKSARLWWPKYIGDYSRKTRHLSMAGHGAFNLLLDHYYQSEKPLPLEWVQLHRICSAVAADEQATVQAVVQEFFRKELTGWVNDRAEQEIEKKKDISQKRREAQAERERQRLANKGFSEGPATQFELKTALGEITEFIAEATANGGANDPCKPGAFADTPTPTTTESKPPKPPNFPQAVHNRRVFNIDHYLEDRHRERAKANAPGWDLYHLIETYNAGIASGKREAPSKNPAEAFITWCGLYTRNIKQGAGG